MKQYKHPMFNKVVDGFSLAKSDGSTGFDHGHYARREARPMQPQELYSSQSLAEQPTESKTKSRQSRRLGIMWNAALEHP